MKFKCRRFTSKYLDTFKFCINTDILEQKKKRNRVIYNKNSIDIEYCDHSDSFN